MPTTNMFLKDDPVRIEERVLIVEAGKNEEAVQSAEVVLNGERARPGR